MNKEIKENVRHILLSYPETKDCDLKLVARYWEFIDGYSSLFSETIYHGEVTHFESIRRCRQRLQSQYEELRGEKYNRRINKLEKEVRENIKHL